MTRVVISMTAATLSVFTLLLAVGWIVGAFPLEVLGQMLLLSGPVGLAWVLTCFGWWQWGGRILPVAFLLQALLSTYEYGLMTTVVFYVLAILLAAMLVGERAQWTMLVLSIVGYVGGGWLHGDRSVEELVAQALTIGGSFIGIALLQRFSVSQLRRALAQTSDYADELSAYRDRLEDLVKERSADLVQANQRLKVEVAERRQAEEELAGKAQDLARSHAFIAALNQVSARIESTRDPDQVLETLGQELRELGLSCAVALLDEDGQALVVRYTSIESIALKTAEKLAGMRLEGYRIAQDISYFQDIVESRRVLFSADPISVTADLVPKVPEALLRRIARLVGVDPGTTAVYLPLASSERVLGTVAVWGSGLHEEDVATLSVFAGQVAASLENARLFQAEQRRTMELSTLLEATQAVSSTLDLEATLTLIAKQIVHVLGVAGCTLSRWDREAGALVTWIERRGDSRPPEEPGTAYDLADFPTARTLLENRQPVTLHLSDPDADPGEVAFMRKIGRKSLLMLPLVTSGRLIGLVELEECDRERCFTEPEIRLSQALVDQAAVAIENAQLYASARQQLEDLQRAEEALRAAHDDLELRVQERTAELRSANAALEAEIVERRRAEAALQSSLAELWNLQHITEMLLRPESLSAVMNTAAQGIVTRLGFDSVLISRYDEETEAFAGLALYPLPEQFDRFLQIIGRTDLKENPLRYSLPYRRGQSPLIDRVLDGEMVLSDSLADLFGPWVPRQAATAAQGLIGMRVLVDLPTRVKGRTVGTIVAGVRAPSIPESQQQALARVADQIAVAMESARLYEQAQQEIAERKRTEAALRESEARYRQLVEHAPAGIYEADLTHARFTSVNDVMCEYTGYTREEFLSLSPLELLTEDSQQKFLERLAKLSAGEPVPESVEYKIKGKGDHEYWVILNARQTQAADGTFRATVVVHDITERKRMEEALRESEEWFRSIVQHLSDVVLVIDPDVKLKYETPSSTSIFGYAPGFLLGKVGLDFVHPDDVDLVQRDLDQVLRKENRFIPTAFRFRHAAGRWIQLEAVANNLLDHPAVQGIVVTARDVTERKQAEAALHKSQALLQSLLESLPQNVYSKDLEGRFTFVNQQFCRTEGKAAESVLGKTDLDLHPPDLAQKYLEDDLWVIENGQIFETVEQHQSIGGERFYVQVVKSPLYDGLGQAIGTLGIYWDVTERRRAEQLLQALNRASLAMEKALTQDEIFAAVAQEFKGLGFSCMILPLDESQGRLFTTYVSIDAASLRAAEKLVGLKRQSFSFPFKDVDVYRQVVEERRTILIENTEEVMRQVLPRAAKALAKRIVQIADYQRAIAAPLIVGDEPIGVLSVQANDLTEADVPAITAFAHQMAAAWRKAQLMQDLEVSLEELKHAQDQLVQAQKMQAVGRLAGGVAHDFNNLLTVVQVNTQFLLHQLHPADPFRERVQQIQDAGQRGARLTKQLLRFGRQEVIEPQVVNLNQIIAELDRMLQRVIGEDIELRTILADSLWPVRVDPSQMEQVIVNLAVNARDAMPRGGRLSIETANVTVEEGSITQWIDLQPGEYVSLVMRDTGVGMAKEVRAHIFEPFFTTKKTGEGTGLGLSTAYGIVKQNNGHIWVESEVERGTTFWIYLPRAAQVQVPPRAPEKEAPIALVRGTENILVVEDEPAVRRLAVQILKAHGYQVLAARDGVEALRVSKEHGGPIHLLLTDVVMPGMNGRDLAERLQSQRPEMRVLYMSGYSDDVIAHHQVLANDIAFLPKPFALEELTTTVRAVLDEAR